MNVALFGMTAKEWRQANPDAKQMMKSLLDSAGIERLKQLEPPRE